MEKDDIELFEVRGINRTSRMGRVSYDAHLQALAQRQAEGRYTLEEAAMTIAENTGERADEMLKDLTEAVRNRVLPVHEPRHSARWKADRVREWHDEATWKNLNAWLAVNHPELHSKWQFPDPLAQRVGTGEIVPNERQAATITTHRLQTRTDALAAVINLATTKAVAPNDNQSVWAELVKLAESADRPAPLLGYSSDGIQYRGKKYEETQEPDVFTAKNLRDRLARAKTR
jgi:hypothetical protein